MGDERDSLRIVHVDTETGFSGGEVQVFLLLEGLRALGHSQLLICQPGSRCESEARRRGFEVRTVRMRSSVDVFAALGLWRAFRASGAQLAHLHTGRATWLGGLAAWLAGLPAVTTRRMDRRVRRGWRTRLIYTVLMRNAAAISPAVAERMAEGGVPRGRITIIQSSIDPSSVAPRAGREATRRAGGLPEDAPLLLTLATLHPRKGIDVLLHALAELQTTGPAPRLWIAGEGPERDRLEQLAGRLGLADRVAFLGRRNDAGDLLAACDMFVMPSRLEGLGVAALEAMAAGRPVVASRVGGLAEVLVHERTGLLVPPDDATALAHALARLIDDAPLRKKLGAEGPRRIAEGWLPEQMVAAYASLYADVLTRPHPPGSGGLRRSSPGSR